MSDTAPAAASRGGVPYGVMLLKGRITEIAKVGERIVHTIALPAASAYDRPEIVQVRAADKLGDRDMEVEMRCKVGGYARKAYEATDPDTGRKRRVVPVTVTLDAI
jgi:hypothetical protein